MIPLGLGGIINGLTKLEDDELVSIEADVDSRCCRDERRRRESIETGVEENEVLRLGACTGCDCRLRALSRGKRIFNDGVFGVVGCAPAAEVGGVEGTEVDVGACRGVGGGTTVDVAGPTAVFLLERESVSFFSLILTLRELRLPFSAA